FPPYGTTDAKNQPDGYDADVAKLLAKDWGVKANIVPVTGPNRIPFLLTNKVDLLVASLAVTPERAKQVQFSQPYAAATIVLYGAT
ncbi:ABC transporter substrate-binding protein, partial [Pseudomonas sp. GW460-R15]